MTTQIMMVMVGMRVTVMLVVTVGLLRTLTAASTLSSPDVFTLQGGALTTVPTLQAGGETAK